MAPSQSHGTDLTRHRMRQAVTVRPLALAALAALPGLWTNPGRAQEPARQATEPIVLREALVIPPVGKYGRSALHIDALEALLVAGKWQPPKAGDKVTLASGSEAVWAKATANKKDILSPTALRGGYAYWSVPSEHE